jgi:hypothetical protein
MKGALDVACLSLSLSLSLKRLSGVGLGGGRGLLYWGSWKIRKERLRLRASLFTGTPLRPRGTWNLEGGSYTGDFEKMNEGGSRNVASLSEGLHERNLEGGLLYWGPRKIC